MFAVFLTWLMACSSPAPSRGVSAPAGVASVGTLLRDARVDTAAHHACLTGDSLFRRMPAISLQWISAIRFDSVWYGDTTRWACQVVAAGHTKDSWASVDTLVRLFTGRGWSDRTMISADGPDGTSQGVHHAGVTCLVQGRWDGGDDSDTTYVPSDTIEVRLACTRTIKTDTLMEPVAAPAGKGADLPAGSRVMGAVLMPPRPHN